MITTGYTGSSIVAPDKDAENIGDFAEALDDWRARRDVDALARLARTRPRTATEFMLKVIACEGGAAVQVGTDSWAQYLCWDAEALLMRGLFDVEIPEQQREVLSWVN